MNTNFLMTAKSKLMLLYYPTRSISFFIVLFLLFFFVVPPTFCKQSFEFVKNIPESKSDKEVNRVLRIGGDFNFPPYEYLNAYNQPEGFNIDIIGAIAEVMGLNVEISLGSWSNVRKQIETGEIDVVMGMYNTEERDKLVDFSIPHFFVSYAVFVRKGSNIKALEDIEDKTIIVQLNDVGHDYLQRNKIGAKIITKEDWEETLTTLANGVGDCAIASRLQATLMKKQNKLLNIEAVGPPVLQHKYSMAVTEGNSSLLAQINEGLSIIKTTGKYDEIYTEWFGVYEEKEFTFQDVLKYLLWIGLPLLSLTLIALIWSWSLRKQVESKTKELRKELKERKKAEKKLLENEHELIMQNDEYEVLNEQLQERNLVIEEVNKELIEANELAEQNNLLKSAFLANMSHEIRTPMNGIIGFSELIANPTINKEEKEEYAKIVMSSSQRLLRLLTDILDISKIETGQLNITYNKVNIYDLFQELYVFFLPQAESKGLHLVSKPGLSRRKSIIRSDEYRLGQIVSNFLSNSIKYSNSGSITMGYERSEGMLKFYVRDQGIGISSEFQEKIFERFDQGDPDFMRNTEGTGLGLAIAKSLVELLGGSVGVKSEKGKGATFWFTHPLEEMEEESSSKCSEIPLIPKFNKNIHVLVAEDEDVNFFYVSKVLSSMNMKVTRAFNGEEAVNFFRQEEDIDLVLMDIKMPIKDGLEATKEIKKYKPLLPIIAITAFATSKDKSIAFEKGCNDYITKPVTTSILVKIIQKHLNLSDK